MGLEEEEPWWLHRKPRYAELPKERSLKSTNAVGEIKKAAFVHINKTLECVLVRHRLECVLVRHHVLTNIT